MELLGKEEDVFGMIGNGYPTLNKDDGAWGIVPVLGSFMSL